MKLAQRCNIACTYCYWFRDADVYKKPAVLTAETENVAFPPAATAWLTGCCVIAGTGVASTIEPMV